VIASARDCFIEKLWEIGKIPYIGIVLVIQGYCPFLMVPNEYPDGNNTAP